MLQATNLKTLDLIDGEPSGVVDLLKVDVSVRVRLEGHGDADNGARRMCGGVSDGQKTDVISSEGGTRSRSG